MRERELSSSTCAIARSRQSTYVRLGTRLARSCMQRRRAQNNDVRAHACTYRGTGGKFSVIFYNHPRRKVVCAEKWSVPRAPARSYALLSGLRFASCARAHWGIIETTPTSNQLAARYRSIVLRQRQARQGQARTLVAKNALTASERRQSLRGARMVLQSAVQWRCAVTRTRCHGIFSSPRIFIRGGSLNYPRIVQTIPPDNLY